MRSPALAAGPMSRCGHALGSSTNALQCQQQARSFTVPLQAASSEADFTMPADLRLERAAFTKSIGFAQVGRAQDAIAARDDAVRAENRAGAVQRARGMLDGQMGELERQKVRGLCF